MHIKSYAAILLLVMLPGASWAQGDTIQESRTITNVRMMGVGSSNVLDTYLSPEKYKGSELRYLSHTLRQYDGKRWSSMLVHEGNIDIGEDRSGDGTTMSGLYQFHYARLRGWDMSDSKLRFEAGWALGLGLGVINNTRNQNNPAQMRLFTDIGPSAAATFNTSINRRPVSLRYEVQIPALGLMFSPNYGQSYYEIFSLGNYDHNIVVSTPFNAPSLRHSLTVDFTMLKTRWRIGFLGDYQQAEVNNLKQHVYSHALVLGIVKHLRLTRIQP